ncbi:MAG: N-acetylmuramoyl-L-alanine amidase [Balneolaceae bacterium]
MTGLKRSFALHAVLFSALWLLCPLFSTPLLAQSEWSRISAVERSDGLGIVIRNHLSEAVDSFQIRQPDPHLIQVELWAEEMDTTGMQTPDPGETLKEIQLYDTGRGFGIDIHLQKSQSYRANGYLDRNGRDMLIALTNSKPEIVAEHAEQVDRIDWDLLTGGSEEVVDDYYLRMRENSKFDTVVIDAGHGGKDPGTIGHGGIHEKDITLAVAQKLGGYIKENLPDVDVIFTRDDDRFLELQERGSIANRARGDLFVSIHANAFPRNPNVRGTEVYFLGLARSESALNVMKRENSVLRLENGNGVDELTEEDLIIYELANAGNLTISERIAEKMEYQFRKRAQRRSRGVKQAQFVVLYHASMPALLIELGFITNPAEARYLTSDYGQSIVASALFRAIRDYKEEFERSRNITRTSE